MDLRVSTLPIASLEMKWFSVWTSEQIGKCTAFLGLLFVVSTAGVYTSCNYETAKPFGTGPEVHNCMLKAERDCN